jgi:hypothetical protein
MKKRCGRKKDKSEKQIKVKKYEKKILKIKR